MNDKIRGKLVDEIQVLSQAASVYFNKYNDLHQASEGKKQHRSLADFVTNTTKAHKAAWKHIVDNSETHKENHKQVSNFLPDSATDSFNEWLEDKED